jgi:hypothetical protein
MKFSPKKIWYLVSFILLATYLVYFHLLNVASPEQVPILGACFSSLWLFICFVFQQAFRNRFEYSIHILLAVDFYLESMTVIHSGYGFYYCAFGFWTVFWFYHHWTLVKATELSKQPSAVGEQAII